jgi:hypothetical protein
VRYGLSTKGNVYGQEKLLKIQIFFRVHLVQQVAAVLQDALPLK